MLYELLKNVQKPARYTGGELNSVVKDKSKVGLRFAFCFPDSYEVGMSHLGLKILYSLINQRENMWCERCFAPWFDMGAQLREHGEKLFCLESRDPLDVFDIIGFTLQYELSYTNILYMLDLAGLPLLASERSEDMPLVIAGGPCACNPEPIADFFDLFVLGEGEEVTLELCDAYLEAKTRGITKSEFLKLADDIEGVYVPSLYKVEYNPDGTVKSYTHTLKPGKTVKKRIVEDFSSAFFPDKFIVPMIEVIHDRAVTEVLRGCIRGCRFCQAGFIYRPFRTRDPDVIFEQAKSLCDNGGFEEVSLTSLSTSDHPQLEKLLDDMIDWSESERVNISLPSLRIDSFSDELIEKTTRVRKSGLTFAPEAGTQRLRDVINKNITEDEIFKSCKIAFEAGYTGVKLYFMMGLPTETDEDILGIYTLAQRIVDLYYANENRQKGKPPTVSISLACFVPKPHTPFQFCAQDTVEEFQRKQRLLLDTVRRNRKISLNWHDAYTSFIEAVFAKGDRRLCKAVEACYRNGGIFDGWAEGFSYERWMQAFASAGVSPEFYANRAPANDEVFPWDILDYGIKRSYLEAEYKKALESKTTSFCQKGCVRCGIGELTGGKCFD